MTKFKIRGMSKISMPASSATIGCSIAAFRVKVIGLAPCSLVRSQRHPVYSTVSAPPYPSIDQLRYEALLLLPSQEPSFRSGRPRNPALEAAKMAAQQQRSGARSRRKARVSRQCYNHHQAVVAAAGLMARPAAMPAVAISDWGIAYQISMLTPNTEVNARQV